MFYFYITINKFHHHLITIDSEYLPQPTETRSSHRKNNTHSYNIPYCRTQYRQMSFFPRTIPEWNSLPQEIVAAKSLDCFKCPPVTRQTTPPLPPPLLFLMSTTPPIYYVTHPFTTFQKCLLQPPQISIIIKTLMLAD